MSHRTDPWSGSRRPCSPLIAVASLALLFTAVAPSTTVASPSGQEATPEPDVDCRLGLALSGGGARGVAQIGALRAFEEAGITFDCIAGTSMGAVIGSLYASGYSPREIETFIRELEWGAVSPLEGTDREIRRELVPIAARRDHRRPLLHLDARRWELNLHESTFGDYRINRFLTRHLAQPNLLAGRRFARLPVPFRAVGTDLRTGDRVVMASGSLARAVRASLSIPLALPPVALDGRLIVDGGLVDNVPVDVATEMGADGVVAVDTTTPEQEGKEIGRDVISIASQLSDVLSRSANLVYREEPDVLVRPDLEGHGYMSYEEFDLLISRGYEAAGHQIARIRDLREKVGPPVVERPQGGPRAATGRRVTGIRVEGNRHVADLHLLNRLAIETGTTYDLERTLRRMDRLFASGLLRSVWLDVLADGEEGAVLVLHVVEESPGTLEVGASFNDEDKVRGFARLTGRDLLGTGELTELEVRGSDRVAALELGYSVQDSPRTGLGLEVKGRVFRDKPRFFVDGEFVNRAEFLRLGTDATAYLSASPSHRFGLGIRVEDVEVRRRLGLDFEPATDRLRQLFGRVQLDTLDDRWLPQRGQRLDLLLERNLASLGAESEYWRFHGLGRAAISPRVGHVVDLRARVGLSDGELPVSEQFRVGGPWLLPGRNRRQLWGDQAVAAAVTYSWELVDNLHLLARAGTGNVWDRVDEIALDDLGYGFGLGASYSTPVGPLAVDYGITEDGDTEFYIALGYR